MLPDYYAVLKVSPNATPERIRAAYRRLAKLRHPDIGGSSDDFRALRQAYEVLSDPHRRRDYDAQRRPRAPRSASRMSPRSSRAPAFPDASFVEPLIPQQPWEPLPSGQFANASGAASLPSETLADFDVLFREFDEFFERLERQFVEIHWGRSD